MELLMLIFAAAAVMAAITAVFAVEVAAVAAVVLLTPPQKIPVATYPRNHLKLSKHDTRAG
jgi:hypothetical protein